MGEHEDYILQRKVEIDKQESDRVRLIIHKRVRGRRLDKYLHGRFPRMSRTLIQRLIKQGSVTVNTQPTKASYEPDKGDVVELWIPPPEPTDIPGEDIPLDVVYEDDHLLVINKPTGIICHPAKPSQGGTLANAAVFHCDKVSSGTDPCRPGIVHRLDKNTTGIMLIAKNDETHWRLGMQFERRTIEKTYLAIVEGDVQLDQDMIDTPLGSHPMIKDRYLVPGLRQLPMATKQAVTRYQVLERFSGFTLLELQPKTGRTHQLRVHCSYMGHPIVGDTAYGGHRFSEQDIAGEGGLEAVVEHQALHAWRIRFVHPILEQTMMLEAPMQDPMQRLLEMLRRHRRT